MRDEIEVLFRTEYPRLIRALSLACGDADRASDAVQEAFLQASKHWRKIRHYDDPGAWLRRVAVNRLADQRRSGERRQRGMAALAVDHARDVSGSGPDLRAELVDLRDALDELPDRQRIAVCLHYLADLSIEQTADALGVAPGTIKSQLHDARRNLLRLLEVNDGS